MKINKLLSSLMLLSVSFAVIGCDGGGSRLYDTPYDLIADACDSGNYSVSIRVSESYSDIISVTDFEAGNFDLNYLRSTLEVEVETQIYAFYTTDYLLVDYYEILNGKEYYLDSILYVNNTIWNGLLDAVDEYYTYDNSTWYYYGKDSMATWQYFYWSLFDNPTSVGLIPYSFYYVDTAKDSDGEYQLYAYASEYVEYVFSYLVGVDLYDYGILGEYDLYSTDYLYLYNDYLVSHFGVDIWYYTDYSYEYAMLSVDTFDTTFYDVGTTDIEDRVNTIVETAK